MFRKYIYTATVQRQQTINDSGYKKSGYFGTGGVYAGHLKALSLRDTIDVSSFGKEFRFHTQIDADIKESDKLIINGDTYDVKGVSNFGGITFSAKMCVLSKTEPGT